MNAKITGLLVVALAGILGSFLAIASDRRAGKKIVLICGVDDHAPTARGHLEDLRLLKHSLHNARNIENVQVHLCEDGWPDDPDVLANADAIFVVGGGSGRGDEPHPLLRGDRLTVLREQMERGCGLFVAHYTSFVPCDRGGDQYLNWVGGEYHRQPRHGKRKRYTAVKHFDTEATLCSPEHPVSRGLEPFRFREEFYHKICFKPDDSRLTPILSTQVPGVAEPQVVAWVIQRPDGGRGGCFTGGPCRENLRVRDFRRMLLNAILWTAKIDVPPEGVRLKKPRKPRRDSA